MSENPETPDSGYNVKEYLQSLQDLINTKYQQDFLKVNERIDELNTTQNRIITELGNTNQTLADLIQQLQAGFNQQPNATTANQPEPITSPASMAALDPLTKAQVLQGLTSSIAQLISAWKGTSQQQPDQFSMLGQQMLSDLVRATVDDIQQRVYGVRKLPPVDVQQNSTPHRLG